MLLINYLWLIHCLIMHKVGLFFLNEEGISKHAFRSGDEYCITEMRIQTLSILKRSPSGERPSRILRARNSFERACLKKRCFKSFSAVGRFTGSFTKQAATISLNDWKLRIVSFRGINKKLLPSNKFQLNCRHLWKSLVPVIVKPRWCILYCHQEYLQWTTN